MDLEPLHVLVICVGLAVPLIAWVIWRAVSRVFNSKVPVWEKVFGLAGLIVGALVAAVQWPLIGGFVAAFGLVVLVSPKGGAAAGGIAGVGGGGGGGCGGGGGGGC